MKKRKQVIYIPNSTTKVWGMDMIPNSKKDLIIQQEKLRKKLNKK